jgi:hypothetical protein
MAKLALWFISNRELLTLDKTLFSHPALSQELRAIRGKTAGAYSGFNSFQWTPAVQAMSVLLLRTAALHSLEAGAGSALLEGYEDSPASSLDYSIAKAPNWLLDIFGLDKAGNPLAKRLFLRTNPERKRKGPVAVALNEKMLSRADITVYLDGRAVTSAQVLNDAAEQIEQSLSAQRSEPKRKARVLPMTGAVERTAAEHPQRAAALPPAGSGLQENLRCPCCGEYFQVLTRMAKAA